MAKPRTEFFTHGQIRQQVDEVMARWQSYPTFAALLDALMHANGLSDLDLARQLRAVGATIVVPTISQYRRGELEAPYSFIESLLTLNALHLDPNRIQAGDRDRPAGDRRVALFAVAGLVEVTPESVHEWNRKVLGGYRRIDDGSPNGPRPRWGDLMAKLLPFHLQGHRKSLPQVAAEIRSHLGGHLFANSLRICHLLNNDRIPFERERLALARYAGLDNEQIDYIEHSVHAGTIPFGKNRQTAFAQVLTPILNKLVAQGISLTQLALLCTQQLVPGGAAVSQPDLSKWRHGHQSP